MPLRRQEGISSVSDFRGITRSLSKKSLSRQSSTSSLGLLRSPTSKKRSSSAKIDEVQSLVRIKRGLTEASFAQPVPNLMIYRFAYFYSFDEEATVEAILRDFGKPQLHLKLTDQLVAQFQTITLFPLPDLKTKARSCRVFYMRPSRFFPSPDDSNTSLIIDNLCYVLNDMSKIKGECRKGVGLIANMEGWTDKNFSEESYSQFMQALQGSVVPTKVRLFLIVNPPSDFGPFWKIIKPMLSKKFAKIVHIIKEQRLGEFLMEGYHEYLPDEFAYGSRSSHEICEDFIDLKRYEEQQQQQILASPDL